MEESSDVGISIVPLIFRDKLGGVWSFGWNINGQLGQSIR